MMKLTIQTIGLVISLAATPAAAEVASITAAAVHPPPVEIPVAVAIPPKDQSRVAMDPMPAAGDRTAFLQSDPDARPPYGPYLVPLAKHRNSHGPSPQPPYAGPMPFLTAAMAGSFVPGPPPVPPTRMTCEEQINLHAALTGYVKAKLNLQPEQKEVWQRLEQAIESGLDKMRKACALLPDGVSPPPDMPGALLVVAKNLSARADFVGGVIEPLRALYERLTPEQRSALRPPFVR